MLEHGADLGLAFDGDADRCFVIDERGEPVSPSAITAMVATREIAREAAAGTPAAKVSIVYNVISSAAVPEIIAEHGARGVRTRVGHSFIKAEMAEPDAVFGGEHSAHYYFRDFWFADTGMLAAMHVLAALGEQDEAAERAHGRLQPVCRVRRDQLDRHRRRRGHRAGAPVGGRPGRGVRRRLDGLTATHAGADGDPMWWLNLRASNTEPLLRLNVEAADRATMERVRDDVLALVRGEAR